MTCSISFKIDITEGVKLANSSLEITFVKAKKEKKRSPTDAIAFICMFQNDAINTQVTSK